MSSRSPGTRGAGARSPTARKRVRLPEPSPADQFGDRESLQRAFPWLLPSAFSSPGFSQTLVSATDGWDWCQNGDACLHGLRGRIPRQERVTILPSGNRACARCSGAYKGDFDSRCGWTKGEPRTVSAADPGKLEHIWETERLRALDGRE